MVLGSQREVEVSVTLHNVVVLVVTAVAFAVAVVFVVRFGAAIENDDRYQFLYSTLQSHSRYRCSASASTRANINIYATTNASSNNAGAQRNAPYANSLAQGAARRSIAGRLFHLLHGHPERGCGARRKDEVSCGKVPGRSVLGVSSSAGRQYMYLLCHLLLRELSVRAPTPR